MTAESESCLIAISKQKLAVLQKTLLDSNNWKDYYAMESFLKGNFLIKDEWRQTKQIENADNQAIKTQDESEDSKRFVR